MILVGQRSVFYWYDHLAACVCVCVSTFNGVQFSSVQLLSHVPFPSVINYTICILLVSQDYYFLYYQVFEPPTKMMTKLEAVDQMYSLIYNQ